MHNQTSGTGSSDRCILLVQNIVRRSRYGIEFFVKEQHRQNNIHIKSFHVKSPKTGMHRLFYVANDNQYGTFQRYYTISSADTWKK